MWYPPDRVSAASVADPWPERSGDSRFRGFQIPDSKIPRFRRKRRKQRSRRFQRFQNFRFRGFQIPGIPDSGPSKNRSHRPFVSSSCCFVDEKRCHPRFQIPRSIPYYALEKFARESSRIRANKAIVRDRMPEILCWCVFQVIDIVDVIRRQQSMADSRRLAEISGLIPIVQFGLIPNSALGFPSRIPDLFRTA